MKNLSRPSSPSVDGLFCAWPNCPVLSRASFWFVPRRAFRSAAKMLTKNSKPIRLTTASKFVNKIAINSSRQKVIILAKLRTKLKDEFQLISRWKSRIPVVRSRHFHDSTFPHPLKGVEIGNDTATPGNSIFCPSTKSLSGNEKSLFAKPKSAPLYIHFS